MSEIRKSGERIRLSRLRQKRGLSGWQLLIALLAAIGLLAAACTGDDGDDAAEEPAATTEAMAEE